MPIVGGSSNTVYQHSTTVGAIIKRALRILGAHSTGETPENSVMADCLEAFNQMVDGWNAESIMLFEQLRNTYTLTGGLNPHTIGPGGVLDAPRPIQIQRGTAYILTSSGVEVELDVCPVERYANVPLKSISSRPYLLWYETSETLGNIYLYPLPDQAYTLILYTDQPLQQSTTQSRIALPPGYADALVWNLAVAIAPEYGKAGKDELKDIAALAVKAKALVKSSNVTTPDMRCDDAMTDRKYFSPYSIYTGLR